MIRKLYDRVYQILRDNPECRNSDRLLLLKAWEDEGLYLSEAQRSKFLQVSSSESLRRTRQKIQADGYFPANSTVKEYRNQKESEVVSEVVTPKVEQQSMDWLTR